ncbi:aminotransferase class I/II-fold pyridoxal phosphate-dependent enzyme [Actinocorallia lasiicapitis]
MTRLAAAIETHLGSGRPDEVRLQQDFLDAFAQWTSSPWPAHPVYSASIALDIAAKHLRGRPGRVGMITPTFDNIPALFRRTGLSLTPVSEDVLMPEPDLDRLTALGLAALVVVTPNNPTGTRMSRDGLELLLAWSAAQDVPLVLDLSFRLLAPDHCWDVAAAAAAVGAETAVIDDTGKTLPAFGSKIGLLSGTGAMGAELAAIVDDVLLTVSELDLVGLGYLLRDTTEVQRSRELCRTNRVAFRESVPSLAPTRRWNGFQPSVEWLDAGDARDRILVACQKNGLALLPGEQFFWDSPGPDGPGGTKIRIPLLRDPASFQEGLDVLREVLGQST